MENKLEQLLNSLIEKGWKPRGLNIMGKIVIDYDIEFAFDIYDSLQKGHWNFRELVSKESGLWQFVCENGMVYKYSSDGETDEWECSYNCDGYEKDDYYKLYRTDYEFYLVESSLKDEGELESFILDNVKIDG